MNFSLSEEQEQLRASLRSFLNHNYPFEARRAIVRSDLGFSRTMWRSLESDLGILGMSLPERVGGLGLDATSTMVVMEELGRFLVVEPYLETVVLCGGLLSRAGGAHADHLLTKVASGDAIVAFAVSEPTLRHDLTSIRTTARRDRSGWRLDGIKNVVIAAPWTTHLLVAARTGGSHGDRQGLSLFVMDKTTPGITLRDYPTIDERRAADITFDGVHLPADALIGEDGQALESTELALDEAIAAQGAEAIGILSQLHEETLAYTKQRRQFGQPLSQFQALRHRMVDMYLDLELAKSSICLATMKLSASPRDRALAASAAKVTVSKACRFIGQSAVQLHGGMGLTDELAVSHRFKRATAIEHEFGTADDHLARYERLLRE